MLLSVVHTELLDQVLKVMGRVNEKQMRSRV